MYRKYRDYKRWRLPMSRLLISLILWIVNEAHVSIVDEDQLEFLKGNEAAGGKSLRRLQFGTIFEESFIPIFISPPLASPGAFEAGQPFANLIFNPTLRRQRASGNRASAQRVDYSIASFTTYPSFCQRRGKYCSYHSECCAAFCVLGKCV